MFPFSSRVWSKKYPIRIRTNQRKPPGDQAATSSEIEQPDAEVDPAAKVKVEDGGGEDVPDVDVDKEEKLVFSALREKSEEEMDFSSVGHVEKDEPETENKPLGEEEGVEKVGRSYFSFFYVTLKLTKYRALLRFAPGMWWEMQFSYFNVARALVHQEIYN